MAVFITPFILLFTVLSIVRMVIMDIRAITDIPAATDTTTRIITTVMMQQAITMVQEVR